jgi:hypothetical protein
MKTLFILFIFLSLPYVSVEFPKGIFISEVMEEQVYWKITKDSGVFVLEVLIGKKKAEKYFGEERADCLIFKNISLFQEPMDFYLFKKDSSSLVLKNDNERKVIFLKKITERTDFELSDVPKLLRKDLDLDLIGDWIILHLLNPEGTLADFELAGKNLKVGFSENGNWVLDPRAFKNQLPVNGGGEFSFSDIPRATWKAKEGNLEVLIDLPGVPNSGPSINKFLIRNDTLYTTSVQGYTTVHLRKK